jgi:hypothetical protein
MELQNLNTLAISNISSLNEDALRQIIIKAYNQIKSLVGKEVNIVINNVYIDDNVTFEKLTQKLPFIGYIENFISREFFKVDYFKIGLNTVSENKYDTYIKVFIKAIVPLDSIIKNNIYIIENYFSCINIVSQFINQQITEQVYFVDYDQLNSYYKKDEAKYRKVCNDAVKQEEYSHFALKLMDGYLMNEKEWFIEQCEHLLHIADVLDGLSDNDLKENNWDIDIYKSLKIRSSLQYRCNPFNRSKYIFKNYPLSKITNYDIINEQKENVKKLKNIYNKFNFFLYSSVQLSEYKKSIDYKYNEYTPYSIYRLSNEQYNELCTYYGMKPTNILLNEQYDFISEND